MQQSTEILNKIEPQSIAEMMDVITEFTGTKEENWLILGNVYETSLDDDKETIFFNSEDKMQATIIKRSSDKYDFFINPVEIH